jgi:MFS family permease
MKKELRWFDYFTINANWFAIMARSQVLTPLVIPLLVQQFVGEANKGTYFGIIRLWALMAALLIQALMGLLSDRNTSKFGRRRPFILIGAIVEAIIIFAIGLTGQLEGMPGYWVLFGLYILSMLGSNISHAATQGFIPDLVPDEKKGLASGIKALLELPLPLVFSSFVVAGMIERGNLWGALASLITVILVAMGITMFAPDKPLSEKPDPINWDPFLRLLGMTAVFTAIIYFSGMGVQRFLNSIEGLPPNQVIIFGEIAGVIGMLIAILFGVLISLRISLGSKVKDQRSFSWWVVNRLAFMVAATNLSSFMVYFLQEKFPAYEGSEVAGPAARIIMFVGIFILVSALPGGWLADKIGKKLVSAISALLVALGAGIVIAAPSLTGIIFIGASVVGVGLGMFYSANWALGTELVPEGQGGKFLGLSNLAGAGAGAVGAYIGGPIGDTSGYVLLMSIYGGMALLSTFALIGIKEQKSGNQE